MPGLPPLFLASESPRRRQILESLGLKFRVLISPTPEKHPTKKEIREIILENSTNKALAIQPLVSDADAVIIAADTLVVLDDDVLGKPKSSSDASQMLHKLSGQTQTVFTGLTLLSRRYGKRSSIAQSEVVFRKLQDAEIEEYLKTREPYDKAGSYAVQGMGALFIDKIIGSYTNVMGLPIELLLSELAILTETKPYLWFLP